MLQCSLVTYVAFTPYHVLLACGFAEDEPQAVLVVVGDFQSYRTLTTLVGKHLPDRFGKVVMLPGLPAGARPLKRVRVQRRNVRALIRLLDGRKVAGAHVFNDARGESQVTSVAARRHGGWTRHIEDGAAAYMGGLMPEAGRLKQFAGQLAYGSWFQSVRILGTSANVTDIFAFFPHLVQNELRKGIVHQYPSEGLRSRRLLELARDYCSSWYEPPPPSTPLCIICPSHSSVPADTASYANQLRRVAAAICATGMKLLALYHPRDHDGDLYQLGHIRGVTVVPNRGSMEYLLLAFGKSVSAVIGDLSTALISARALTDVPVFSIAPMLSLETPSLGQLHDAIGVTRIHRMSDLDLG